MCGPRDCRSIFRRAWDEGTRPTGQGNGPNLPDPPGGPDGSWPPGTHRDCLALLAACESSRLCRSAAPYDWPSETAARNHLREKKEGCSHRRTGDCCGGECCRRSGRSRRDFRFSSSDSDRPAPASRRPLRLLRGGVRARHRPDPSVRGSGSARVLCPRARSGRAIAKATERNPVGSCCHVAEEDQGGVDPWRTGTTLMSPRTVVGPGLGGNS